MFKDNQINFLKFSDNIYVFFKIIYYAQMKIIRRI